MQEADPISQELRIKESLFEFGSSSEVLAKYASEQVHLVWTSPPYFNQRKEYAEYSDLTEYLKSLASVFGQCIRLLRHTHIIAVNIAQDRAVDLQAHVSMLLEDFGLRYIDSIVWNKGGELGPRAQQIDSGRYYPSFAYEMILVYQKPPLISAGGQALSKEEFPEFEFADLPYIRSTLATSVWNIPPSTHSWHPAPFPMRLAESVIRCYTQKKQIVLDPYGGSGTTAKACVNLHREYLLVERNKEYYDQALKDINSQNLTLGF